MGTDTFTANMYLAEGRVHGKCDVPVVGLGYLYSVLIDPMPGTGVKAWWSMGSSLCQVSICCYGYAGSGASQSVLE